MSKPDQVKKVVVAVDEKELSRHAVEAGMRLASAFGAELDLVHAITVDSYISTLDWHALHERVANEARERVTQSLATAFPDDAERLAGKLTIADGPPGKALSKHVEAAKADLLLLGGHEKRGLLDFGSTVRAVIHDCPCPIWMQPNALAKVERVVVPVDMSEANRGVLEWARELSVRFDASVRLAHWFTPPYFAYSSVHADTAPTYTIDALREGEQKTFHELAGSFDWSGVEVEEHFGEGEPEENLLAEQRDGDLIVMGTHGRSGWARAVLGSVAYGVLKSARVPVVAVPFEPEG